ncbi:MULTISPECIES: LysE family transporter [Dictyoglomus]|jgi:threonine/homoserine/homoserine lactone efflux protein|uniref:Lysine exporter protein (LYSE/YGGA) n=1 Tax=Dictyoglomus turgidum (strain DSM 6724 / Z-1310) TaxID=515635 RepID=B8DZK7_DICTD|nr:MULTISPECIES: LysE family transporter [Dictyoglomus]ACK41940.1 Lysine exporter protein (LYSE/YGGA) [Dictyoglomus turgidum DSM 6724]PNV79235.1 MAG: lysine transporter LysE [Dictyoglomus turgidum]HBU31500.1 lysine transporter LysE [Dictyoglomus sp.]
MSLGIWGIFITSFLVGFSGASSPGPMLTMVLTQSSIKGWFESVKIVTGHAILEGILVILLLLGLQPFLQNQVFLKIFSFLGSLFLLYMGIGLFVSLLKNNIHIKNASSLKIPSILGGILVSFSNPYWLMWWITIGVSFLTQAKDYLIFGVLSFYFGHILSDYVWYAFIGLIGQGLSLPFWKRIYKVILYFASVFLIFFGIYFMRYVFVG